MKGESLTPDALPHTLTVMNWWSNAPPTSCTERLPHLVRIFLLADPKQYPVSSAFHIRDWATALHQANLFKKALDSGEPTVQCLRTSSHCSLGGEVLRFSLREGRPSTQESLPPIWTRNTSFERRWSFLVFQECRYHVSDDFPCEAIAKLLQHLAGHNNFLLLYWGQDSGLSLSTFPAIKLYWFMS